MTYIYYAHLQDWDINDLLVANDDYDFGSISHKPTLHQKVLNRTLLRYALHEHFGLTGNEIVLGYTQKGKPYLQNHPQIHFNSSHSHDLVLIGLSEKGSLGVDVEQIIPLDDEEELAIYHFSANEYSSYKKLKRRSNDAFYKFWTAKEATLKAFGYGLSDTAKVPEIILDGDTVALQSNDWTVDFIDIQAGYVACVVS